jgi:hypothetical protein
MGVLCVGGVRRSACRVVAGGHDRMRLIAGLVFEVATVLLQCAQQRHRLTIFRSRPS